MNKKRTSLSSKRLESQRNFETKLNDADKKSQISSITSKNSHKRKKSRWYDKFFKLFSLLTFLFIFALIILVFVFTELAQELPSYEQLAKYDPPTITRLYTKDASVVSELAEERRIFVLYDEVPRVLIEAFLSAEDKNFFQHSGIDLMGTTRAVFQYALSFTSSRKASGGSTITQQVVKNFLLTNERTIKRKIKEAILAYKISQVYSKERIMELYLNQIFLGNNSYGVVAAAQNYFGKELKDLTVPEAAMLAALPKAPSSLNPFTNYANAIARRNWVIKRMTEENFITDEEARKYSEEPIHLVRRNIKLKVGEGFYVESVKQQLINMYGYENVYKEGYVVNINLDEKLQKFADSALRKGIIDYDRKHGWRGPIKNISESVRNNSWQSELKEIKASIIYKEYDVAVVLHLAENNKVTVGFINGENGTIPFEGLKWARKNLPNQRIGASITKSSEVLKVGDVIFVSYAKEIGGYKLEQIPDINGALIVIQPVTGKILAMAGGYSFEGSYFNRAIQAIRQPGSAFKTFVYLKALEDGYTPDDLVYDGPISIYQGPNMPAWTPKNVTDKFENRYMTISEAFTRSFNTPAIRILLAVGIKNVFKLAKEMGIYEDSKQHLGYAAALGAFETTLLKLTNAYNIFVSGGYKTKPRLIDTIYDRHGNLIYADDSVICKGCNEFFSFAAEADEELLPSIAYFREGIIDNKTNNMMLYLLEQVVQNGAGKRAKVLNKHVGGKTGTTNDNFDTWFLGSSADFTVGVYLGFDSPRTMGKDALGASTALPIFVDFMKNAPQDVSDRPLTFNEQNYEIIATNEDGAWYREGVDKISNIWNRFDNVGSNVNDDDKEKEDDDVKQKIIRFKGDSDNAEDKIKDENDNTETESKQAESKRPSLTDDGTEDKDCVDIWDDIHDMVPELDDRVEKRTEDKGENTEQGNTRIARELDGIY